MSIKGALSGKSLSRGSRGSGGTHGLVYKLRSGRVAHSTTIVAAQMHKCIKQQRQSRGQYSVKYCGQASQQILEILTICRVEAAELCAQFSTNLKSSG